jgi:hypothetical protein
MPAGEGGRYGSVAVVRSGWPPVPRRRRRAKQGLTGGLLPDRLVVVGSPDRAGAGGKAKGE